MNMMAAWLKEIIRANAITLSIFFDGDVLKPQLLIAREEPFMDLVIDNAVLYSTDLTLFENDAFWTVGHK